MIDNVFLKLNQNTMRFTSKLLLFLMLNESEKINNKLLFM